jgi:hypothetical protein
MTPTDDEILQSVADLCAEIDPAPEDLADGVLARLAVEGLENEYELLTLVERVDVSAGTRSASATEAGTETTATVALEFAGTAYRVLVRISTADDVRRLDGWVVPAVPMRVFLGAADEGLAGARLSAFAASDGRFEFGAPITGEVRLWLLPQPVDGATTGDTAASGAAPGVPSFVTPPFLV